ncbi:pyocin activator PrtN family protein [uncultured Pseudoalteromonas sp.]|uniref:pyocin activator PrtN family protein n=1 Tax=uncultured Pseudoalteromonas sp. TaxID=114053 RepID=UPI000C3E66C6|nr:pyocin activator PrtN family protein [uncultured Pseudoalteromonas sp.]MBD55966.1 hypothetical protein [Pseudoalteromonas sp.]|tara:strand:+ start:24756 stop:25070 length:315 start_codon:yes stop_codon:yes gene_type:complete
MFDNANGAQALAYSWMISFLTLEFGKALIPYTEVAARYLGWKAEKTAKARIADGTVRKLGLVLTIPNPDSKNAPVFVNVSDLANFLMDKKDVIILDRKGGSTNA